MKNASLIMICFFLLFSCGSSHKMKIVVLVSANAEWRVIKSVYPNENFQSTPWGEYFEKDILTKAGKVPVVFFS